MRALNGALGVTSLPTAAKYLGERMRQLLLRGKRVESALAFDQTRVLATVANEGLVLVDGATATQRDYPDLSRRLDELGRPEPWNPRDTLDKPCYDATGMLESLHFLDEMVGYMNALGWDVHSFDHEDGNGQYEFDFSYTDAVAMADRFMLFRMMAKQVARSHGYEAVNLHGGMRAYLSV